MLDSAFDSYVTVMSITPGPDNLLLASSGYNFGLRHTLPMLVGISLGCAMQLVLTTSLLALVLHCTGSISFPLAASGGAYLLWLSWKLFRAGSPGAKQQARPMRVLSGAVFQAVNPKAWLMAINIAILFTPREGAGLSHTLMTIIAFTALNIPCVLVWALVGDRLRDALRITWKLRLFNVVMSGLMATTALWLLFDEWHAAVT